MEKPNQLQVPRALAPILLPMEQPNQLKLPHALAPILLQHEVTQHDVVFVGEVYYKQQVLAPEDTGAIGCCWTWSRGGQKQRAPRIVDVKMVRPPGTSTPVDLQQQQTTAHPSHQQRSNPPPPLQLSVHRSLQQPPPQLPQPPQPQLDGITVSVPEPAGVRSRTPMLKGLLRSPFLNGMRSVSRDKPGRLHSRKSQSAPATAIAGETVAKTANRVAFSIHA